MSPALRVAAILLPLLFVALIRASDASPGRLTAEPVYLAAPVSAYQFDRGPDLRPQWNFGSTDIKAVEQLLTSVGMSPRHRVELLQSARPSSPGTLTLFPTAEVILGLSPAGRTLLYESLAPIPGNAEYSLPVLVPVRSAEEWVRHAGFSPLQAEALHKLWWKRGDCFALSDVPLLAALAASSAEREAALNAFSLTRGLRVNLALPTDEERACVIAYWSNGQPRTRIEKTMAEATARGVREIDIIDLLPPLCRERIYTFPSSKDFINGEVPDCGWSSLSFFSNDTTFRSLSALARAEILKCEYHPIPEPTRLGDLLCFFSNPGTIDHICVFIADDIVFTKNGRGFSKPWVLMSVHDVAAIYQSRKVSEVRFFRRNSLR